MMNSILDFSDLSIVEISFIIAIFIVILTSFMALYRGLAGPKRSDRILAINVITNNVIIILVTLAFTTENYTFVDAATVFVLCAFIGTLSVLKYLIWGQMS